ncbi:unnamed protein product [Callosobruchus maculatus]|uniref:Pacifastin domain-containing protein n=1 Tax=Callosobruchus maculatus TaxID=64391 RepID=A0A653BPF7_CALMS|nr:unnamed protein product [Callosobruchus maculatus]
MDKLWVLFVVSTSLNLHSSDASICKPYSYFKMDCNTCACDKTGKEYSCTRFICRPKSHEVDFIVDKTDDGQILLRPKPKLEHDVDINDEDYIFVSSRIHNRKTRVSPKFRYVDDEIPSIPSSLDIADYEDEDDMNNHVEETNENSPENGNSYEEPLNGQ